MTQYIKKARGMITIDYIRYLLERGYINSDYRYYRVLKGKTKYKVKKG